MSLGLALKLSTAPLFKGVGVGPWERWISGLSVTQVLDFDFAKTDRFFQEAVGETLADDAGESIGLALDSAAWAGVSLAVLVAAQPELMSNPGGPYTTTSGYIGSAGGALSIVSGNLRVTNGSALYGAGYATISTASDRFYRQDVDIVATPDISYPSAGSTPGGYELLNNPRTAGNNRSAYYKAVGALTYPKPTVGVNIVSRIAEFARYSVKEIPGNHALQATSNLQGKRQAGGVCRYDGSDDNHLTTFLAQNGAMTLLFRGSIAASIAAVQVLLGASGSGANRCWMAVDTSGHLCAGVGSQSSSTIVGTKDIRGKNVVAAVTFDGAAVSLFLLADGVVTTEYSGAQASTPTTTIPFRLAANNNNGSAGSYAGIDANRFRAAHKAMSLADFTTISAAMAT